MSYVMDSKPGWYYVVCDLPGCNHMMPPRRGWFFAEEWAVRRGWATITRGELFQADHLCPECVAKHAHARALFTPRRIRCK